jgi:hypothetical protein
MAIEARISRAEVTTVGATSIQVCAVSPYRRALYFHNSSTAGQVITLNLGLTPAVANAGIVLNPTQSFAWTEDLALACWKGGVTVIADAAAATLSIFEA